MFSNFAQTYVLMIVVGVTSLATAALTVAVIVRHTNRQLEEMFKS